MIVVDTNTIAYFWLSGPHTGGAERLYREDSDWSAPLLWRSELRNVLTGFVRRDELSLGDAQHIMGEAAGQLAGREFAVPSDVVLALSAGSGLSAYDCEFVALAEELGVPLFTSDKKILAAFPRVATSLKRI